MRRFPTHCAVLLAGALAAISPVSSRAGEAASDGFVGARTAEQVEAELARRDFLNVQRLRRHDTIWQGMATYRGERVRLMIDTETGEIRTWDMFDWPLG